MIVRMLLQKYSPASVGRVTLEKSDGARTSVRSIADSPAKSQIPQIPGRPESYLESVESVTGICGCRHGTTVSVRFCVAGAAIFAQIGRRTELAAETCY